MSGLVLAFLGSGEFEPWSEEVDRWLLSRTRAGDGSVLVLPTASAAEGDAVFEDWGRKALAHYERARVRAEVLPLKTRPDASRPELVARLLEASLVYVSGGNPSYLASVVAGTPFWETLVARLRAGMAYAGCSAGVACLTEDTYDSDVQEPSDALWRPGLGLVRDLLFGPHWDVVDTWVPGARDFIVGSLRDGCQLVGLDEGTAMVGDGTDWEVVGSGSIHVCHAGAWTRHASGGRFRLRLHLAE